MGVSEILDQWPDRAAVALDLGVPFYTVATWRHRGRIPPKYWRPLVAAAAKRALPGVTLDTLLDALLEAPPRPTVRTQPFALPQPGTAPARTLSHAAAAALAQFTPAPASHKPGKPGP